MNVRYDAATDALYLRLAEATVSDSEEVRPGIVLDFDATGRLVGIEVLDATEHLASGADLAGLVMA